jgi:hypothetical protein
MEISGASGELWDWLCLFSSKSIQVHLFSIRVAVGKGERVLGFILFRVKYIDGQ